MSVSLFGFALVCRSFEIVDLVLMHWPAPFVRIILYVLFFFFLIKMGKELGFHNDCI
jgi:hypothetical protein